MAIYHLTAKTVSRGGTSSAQGRFEYVCRAWRFSHDANEVQHVQSGNMPAWAMENPGAYWSAADLHERANGRLFKQLEFALPRELSEEEQTVLAVKFVKCVAASEDGPLPYTFAVHKGHDRGNPHCHLMLSERVNDGHARSAELWFRRAAKKPEEGGAKKSRALKPQAWLENTRLLWEKLANSALERAGHDARIDRRTLEAQGITDRLPTSHLGPVATALERKGIRTARKKRLEEEAEAKQAKGQLLERALDQMRDALFEEKLNRMFAEDEGFPAVEEEAAPVQSPPEPQWEAPAPRLRMR